jgi:6-phosphogluconolactonase/glucosamine-6-phosphate isomerase/deaminase
MARTISYDQLRVSIFDTAAVLATAAADDLTTILGQAIAERGTTAAIFATGNSQLAFYQALHARNDIAWERVSVFHMDEYLGLDAQHPASFRHVMQERLVAGVRPRAFYAIAGDAPDVAAELERYADRRYDRCCERPTLRQLHVQLPNLIPPQYQAGRAARRRPAGHAAVSFGRRRR